MLVFTVLPVCVLVLTVLPVCVCVAETYSEAVKLLKGEYVVRAINKHNMDRALVFCRTKLDCDNLERYLNEAGGGNNNNNNNNNNEEL